MRTRWAVGLLVLAALGAGCSDDGGTGPSQESLAGTWRATKLEYVSVANPANRVEAIGLGMTFTIVLQGNGTFAVTMTHPGEPNESFTGTWSVSHDVFTMRETGEPFDMQFDFVLSGSTLTLTGADVDFDINGDDVEEPCKVNVTLVR